MNALNIDDDFDVDDEMEDLVSAEDFLEFFDIEFDQSVVHVYRLHILQRYHDDLSKAELSDNQAERFEQYKSILIGAYEAFVESDAKTEKALKIYKNLGPQSTFVSMDDLFK
jgi:nitrogenase-stabilizing/protective protein